MNIAFKSLLTALILVLPLAACGNGEQNSNQGDGAGNGTGDTVVTIDRNAGGIHSQAGANLNLPTGFPDDIAIFPGMNIYGASEVPGMGYSLSAISDAAPADVAEFYVREMTALGWTDASTGGGGAPSQVLRFEKEARVTSVNLMPNNGGTTLSITSLTQS